MIQPRIRVVHVIHSLGPGGAEHTLVELAGVAPEQGMDLSVVSLMPLGSNSFPRQLTDRGAEVHSLNLASRGDPRGMERGRRLIQGLAPDIVHTHLKHADLVGAWSARRLGIPMVSTLHLIEDAPTTLDRGKRWLAAQARLRTAAVTIAVSQPLREWYLGTFLADSGDVVHIPNGVANPAVSTDAERSAIRREFGVRPGAVMATTVGILRPEKGHAVMLSAADRLSSDIDVQFVVVGDGPEREVLEGKARRLGLIPERVVFAGYREDVAEVLAASDIVVHPSLEDALPTALLYALAAGRPIVASDVGGIPEIVTPDIGLLVRPSDPDALADALNEMIGRLPASHIEDAGRKRFAEEYDASIWAARLRRQYDDILAGNESSPT